MSVASKPPAARGHRRFRPRPWSCLLTLFGCAALLALGFWQIARGEEKARLITQQEAALRAPASPLSGLDDERLPTSPQVMKVRARGRYLSAQQLLMGGRSNGDAVGYDVLTPLAMDDGRIVLVDRGWIPQETNPQDRPDVEVAGDERTVHGLWRHLPQPGLRLQAHNCREQPWPRVVQYPTHADLVCLYGSTVRDGVLELGSGEPDGYVRHWTDGDGFPPARHYAYAAQWFAFCLVALFLFVRLNLKPVPGPVPSSPDPIDAEN